MSSKSDCASLFHNITEKDIAKLLFRTVSQSGKLGSMFQSDCSPFSQLKLEINLEQIPYQNIFVPRSCIRSGLATQNLFTLDIHRRIFRRVKSKIAEDLTEIT